MDSPGICSAILTHSARSAAVFRGNCTLSRGPLRRPWWLRSLPGSQGSGHGQRKNSADNAKRKPAGNGQPVGREHFARDEDEDDRKPLVKVAKSGQRARQRKVK